MRAILRRVTAILLRYDPETLALALGTLTCGFGLIIALGGSLSQEPSTRLFGASMALAGGLQLGGLLADDWRVQLVGAATAILGWATLASLAWLIHAQLAGSTAELALYAWLVMTHSLVLWRLYWDWLRRPVAPNADTP